MTKKRFLLALALMLTAVGGAWAQGEQSEAFTTATDEQLTYTGTHFTITGQVVDEDGLYITGNNVSTNQPTTVTISAINGETITRIEAVVGYCYISDLSFTAVATSGTVSGSYSYGQTITISDVNASTVTLSSSASDNQLLQFKSWTVYYTEPTAPLLVKDNDTLWHLAVPAGNVTLTVDYYGQYTLDSVPTAEGWQVKVNGTLATVTPYSPGSALGHVDNINETDSVELIPPAELRETIKAVRLTEVVPAPEPITVTINQSDWGNATNSFTKDGVTVSAGMIDPMYGDLGGDGTFSTTLGNFTSIVVNCAGSSAYGTGWSGTSGQKTWSGTPASSVSFSGSFMGEGMGQGQTTIVCTIQPTN